METGSKTREQVRTELDEMRKAKMKALGARKYFDAFVDFEEKLLAKGYTKDDLDRYDLYHLISGSSTNAEESPDFDLPGAEIEHFIRHEL